ncbi:MAG TPA: hypothetical protein VFG52_07345 [Xanthomonadales bacterium]|nr:hypothetical protein [Xanthomonadales bacterium]
MNTLCKTIAATLGCLLATSANASDFDGSKPLICATIEARDCVLGSGCFTGEAKTVGAPAFFRLDFKNKTVVGQQHTSPISAIVQDENALLLQGSEVGYGWSIGISKHSGSFSASLTNFEGSFLLFGNCTVQ